MITLRWYVYVYNIKHMVMVVVVGVVVVVAFFTCSYRLYIFVDPVGFMTLHSFGPSEQATAAKINTSRILAMNIFLIQKNHVP